MQLLTEIPKKKEMQYLISIVILLSMGNYTPPQQEVNENTTVAIASYYGGKFHGRTAADGSTFDTTKMTAAYNQVPLGTMITVCRPRTGKCITVKVTDRTHPRFKHRVDLSQGAFRQLAELDKGIMNVEIDLTESAKF